MTKTELVIHFLDIGQGDTILGILPHGQGCFMVDVAESDDTSKMLLENGDVEFILITHSHADHVGGLHALIRDSNIIPKAIYLNYDRGPGSKPTLLYKELLRNLFFWCTHYGIKILPIHSGISFSLSDVLFDVLAPDYAFLGYCIANNSINDSSVVVKVNYLGNSLVLTGDIEADGIVQLFNSDKRGCLADIDIIKIPHHGGVTLEPFSQLIQTINPKFAVACLAKINKYNHPNKDIIQFLEKKGIKIVYTYEHPTEPHPTFLFGENGITLKA
jgi:competence protein ComEC